MELKALSTLKAPIPRHRPQPVYETLQRFLIVCVIEYKRNLKTYQQSS